MSTETEAEIHNEPGGRLPTIESAAIDRLSLVQALKDFEIANARVVDLTSRLTQMHERMLSLQHELSVARLDAARAADLQTQYDFVVFERDTARQEALALRSSRSYRIGQGVVGVVKRFVR